MAGGPAGGQAAAGFARAGDDLSVLGPPESPRDGRQVGDTGGRPRRLSGCEPMFISPSSSTGVDLVK